MALSTVQNTRLLLAGVGVEQGIIYYVSLQLKSSSSWRNTCLAALCVLVTVAGLSVQYGWTGQAYRRLLSLALGLGLLFAAITFWVGVQMPGDAALFSGDEMRAFTWAATGSMALYILMPFLQIVQRTGRPFFLYGDLFQHSWNNLFIGLIAAVFAGVFWLLLLLWAQLFQLIGIGFFVELFTEQAFVLVSTMAAAGYGLAIGKENDVIINTLRRITLAIFYVFMPLLSGITLLFLVTLPFTGLQPLWDTRHASSLLLGLLALTIVFINAVFQDGTVTSPYPIWIRWGVEAALFIMPVWCILAGLAIRLRIQQYGLTPERVHVTVLIGIASAYALGYVGALLWRGPTWLAGIRRVNVPLALGVALLGVLLHTPWLDPLRWSARSQYARLAAGDVDAAVFDYAFLRFKLGHVGAATLEAIEKLADHPHAAVIQERLAVLRTQAGYRETATGTGEPLHRSNFLLLGDLQAEAVPASLITFLENDLRAYAVQSCQTSQTCALLQVNLDDEPDLEYVVVVGDPKYDTVYTLWGYDQTAATTWFRLGTFFMPGHTSMGRAALFEQIRRHGVETALPVYKNVKIGAFVFKLRDE